MIKILMIIGLSVASVLLMAMLYMGATSTSYAREYTVTSVGQCYGLSGCIALSGDTVIQYGAPMYVGQTMYLIESTFAAKGRWSKSLDGSTLR